MSPALADRFLTTGPPGKPNTSVFDLSEFGLGWTVVPFPGLRKTVGKTVVLRTPDLATDIRNESGLGWTVPSSFIVGCNPLWEQSLFSIIVVPIYIPTSSVGGFLFLHTLSSIYYL